MAKISSKRQITLPVDQCEELGIRPGDEVEVFAANGVMTIIKKRSGAAQGLLEHIPIDKRVSDTESLQSSLR